VSASYRFGDFQVDVAGFRLLKAGEALPVEPKALSLLIFLIENRGRLVERRELISAVWQDAFVTDHVLNRAVGQLRKLLDEDPKQPRYIETVPTLGYRFIANVEGTPEPGAVAGPVRPTEARTPSPLKGARQRVALVVGLAVLAGAALVLSLTTGHWGHASGASVPIRSLAVLPLENLSGDPSQEYLADGMTADLISNLGRIGALRVISQTTALQYKNARKSLPQIAKELNVDAVVEGSVMRSQDQIRIAAQLVDAPGDKQIWSGTYDGDLTDILGLENHVATDVAEKIRIQLSPQEKAQLSEARPVDPRATEALFKGEAALGQNSPESTKNAIAFYELATKLDPTFALAYVDLAKGYNYSGGWGSMPVGEATAAADAALAKALMLDPNLGSAYEEKAWTLTKFRWDFPEAEADFRRSIELNPGSASAHDGLSEVLVTLGRFDESTQEMAHALEIDPRSLVVNMDYCRQLAFARRFDRAKERCAFARALDPDYFYAKVWSTIIATESHDYATAHAILAKWDCDTACLAAHDELGGAPGVHGAFDVWLKESRPNVDAFSLAADYAELGRKNLAFEWLENAYEQRSEVAGMQFLPVDARFDNLRSDPRFDAFLRHVGLPPQPREALAKAGVKLN
jgi:TolB-like protein/DNA-binding winged helix-turn-helix (wHTH) protein